MKNIILLIEDGEHNRIDQMHNYSNNLYSYDLTDYYVSILEIGETWTYIEILAFLKRADNLLRKNIIEIELYLTYHLIFTDKTLT